MTIEKFRSAAPSNSIARWVEMGQHHAAAINEIRERGLPAATEYARTLGGVSDRCAGLARSLMALASRAGDVPAKRLERATSGTRAVVMMKIPHLTWRHTPGGRQVAHLEWWPVRAFPAPKSAAA